MFGAELGDAAFDAALETEALEAEPTHGPVGLVGPRHKGVGYRDRWIDPVVAELDVGVDPGAGEARAVELAWTQGHYHF